VIPNWGTDGVDVAEPAVALVFRQKLGIPADAFVAVYAGNVGVASNADMLVDAFAKLADLRQAYLLIAGDGALLDACRAAAERQRLDRVIIHSPWKSEETGPVLQMADVLLLPTKGNQSLNSIPSKLITYLLSARPVIAGVLPESDTATAILENCAGWVIAPDSADLMAKTIRLASAQSKESLTQMGTRGREFARQSLTQDSNLSRIIEVIEASASKQHQPNNVNGEQSGVS
jgi:colanic acid biosynthesis glycosyl transferase WcaI